MPVMSTKQTNPAITKLKKRRETILKEIASLTEEATEKAEIEMTHRCSLFSFPF
jgi:hypothetical protein